MSQSEMIVLAVLHELQGPGFLGFVDVPSYRELVKELIHTGVDFVFEEAAGRGPSIAEDLTDSILKSGHYLDVDLPADERPQHGMAKKSVESVFIDPCGNHPDSCGASIVDEQEKRENFWLQRIQSEQFTKGLVVCGIAHGLSLAFRLRSAGISVSRVLTYTPYATLCNRVHQ
jgi:hypothetical protein